VWFQYSARASPALAVECGGFVRAMTNMLYFGDNLDWLPKIESSNADLIYLDPPFNSKAAYNLLL